MRYDCTYLGQPEREIHGDPAQNCSQGRVELLLNGYRVSVKDGVQSALGVITGDLFDATKCIAKTVTQFTKRITCTDKNGDRNYVGVPGT